MSATYEKSFDDENWEIPGRYYGEMRETIEPTLDKLTAVYEIGSVYDYLTSAAMLFLDIEAADRYQGELKSKLLSMKNDVEGPEANALLNRYLGDVELHFEMPMGEVFVWPFRFAAVAVMHDGAWRFHQMQFSYSNTRLPDVRMPSS